ncbi:MFS transporter [Elizabethkingia bruuniana]|nr:MFS transporter [Elizabethkingia bruuniana]
MNNSNNENMDIQNAGWGALFSNGNGLKATVLALGVMLHATNVYLATTIMPSIIKEIGGLEYYAWNTTIFVVASVIGSVISANKIAKLGPLKAYQTGIIIFSIGTLICSLAPAMHILIFGRFVQGLGGGLLFALSYAMIRLIFNKNLWPRAMALVSGMWGVAAFSGPFLGGIFAEYKSWRWAFGSLLIICLFIFIVASIVLPKEKNAKNIPLVPYTKLLLLCLAALAVSIGSVPKNVYANIAGVTISVLFLILLVIAESKQKTRLLPSGGYKISFPLGSKYAIMALLTIATAIEIYVPYFAQIIYKFTPLESGYLTVLVAAGWTLSSIIFSGYKGHSVNRLIYTGSFIMFIGLFGLCYNSLNSALSPVINISLNCIFLLAIGMGIGMGWPHLLTGVFSLSPVGEEDLTSASVTTVQLMATTFGAALAGLVTNIGGISSPGGIIGAESASIYLYGFFSITPLIALFILYFSKKEKDRF